MKTKKQNPNKLKLIELLVHNGWKVDRYGHYKKEYQTKQGIKTYRFKFQETSVRYEVKSSFVQEFFGKAETVTNWIKLDGDYYSKLVVNDDSIRIGTRTLKKITK
ncbi:MAG: hypothetical protein WC679_01300 [Bacteroidales bacterium]|jgi:hypothetical protein